MTTYSEEQLASMLEGQFAIPKELTHPLDPADPAVELERKAASQDIATALSKIGEQEAAILKMRFGFGGEVPMTLEEVAKKMRLHRERVFQIQERALLRMRRVLSGMDEGIPPAGR